LVATTACTLTLSFNGVWVVNGAGADFTVFDVNSPSNVKATLNGITLVRSAVLVGTTPRPPAPGTSPWNLNAADFDLTDFGLEHGAKINLIDFQWGYSETTATRTGFALVGAMNTAPMREPASLLLQVAGLGWLGCWPHSDAGSVDALRPARRRLRASIDRLSATCAMGFTEALVRRGYKLA
jgi:hypothetical protein